MKIRVLIVDDSALFRRVVERALEGIPQIEVVGSCRNGRAAFDRIRAGGADLMILDIEMPEMNGIQVLEAIRRDGLETGVIVLSAAGENARAMTVRALELGAFDFVGKPENANPEQNLIQLREELTPRILAAGHRLEVRSLLRVKGDNHQERTVSAGQRVFEAALPRPAGGPSSSAVAPCETAARMGRIANRLKPAVVLIGVSTGGPVALTQLIPQLPASLGVPVLVVQHMPPLFTRNLAENLNSRSAVSVREAEDGQLALPGHVYIAPGGKHLKVVSNGAGATLRISNDPPENNCRPAVDVLFRSAAEAFPGRSVAVILTGMGADGVAGMRVLKADGCLSIAQDETSCVVFGMPKEAIRAGVIDVVLPLGSISGAIIKATQPA